MCNILTVVDREQKEVNLLDKNCMPPARFCAFTRREKPKAAYKKFGVFYSHSSRQLVKSSANRNG